MQEQIATSCAPTQSSQSRNTSSTNTVTGLFSVIVAICFPLFAFHSDLDRRGERYKSGVNVSFFFFFFYIYLPLTFRFTRRRTLYLMEYLVIAFFYCTDFGILDFLFVSLYTLSVMLTLCCLHAHNRRIHVLQSCQR